MNTRLLGAAVLIALAVLFVPMFFSSKPPAGGDQSVSLAIPPAPDGELQTKTMSLNPQVPPSAATVAAGSAAPPVASGDQLATVNIGSNRPLDVETDPRAGKAHENSTVTIGTGASPTQPVIPMQPDRKPSPAMIGAPPTTRVAQEPPRPPTAETPHAAPTPAAPTPPPAMHAPAAAAGAGAYLVNLGAYANAGNVESLRRQLKSLGYPSTARPVSLAGKHLTQVAAGPFETRTAAEAARLRITHSVQGVRPSVDHEAGQGEAAAAPATSVRPEAGGWAVQLAALGSEADANALRDKLRAAGFDGYVRSVTSAGKHLWQVRAGPMTQRAEAEHVQGQIKAKLGIPGVVRRVP